MSSVAPPDPRTVAEARVGETLNGKWHLDRLLEIGGMAAVYVATHRNGKRVAVKLLHTYVAANAQIRERFLREGYAANKVDHPGAVSVLDDDTTPDGSCYLVMELLEGESVEAWLARAGGRLRPSDVLAMADQVLDVLAAAHAKDIVHRDIKPANLFSTKTGQIKVLDFGLARMRDPKSLAPATAAGIVMGTSAYMPPEQAQGKPDQVDGRTDLFAVGAVMFRALTGRTVHNHARSEERLFAAMKDRAPSLATLMTDAPSEVVHVVDRALCFEKLGRWPDAAAMRAAVRAAYASMKERSRTRPPPLPVAAEASAPPMESVSFEMEADEPSSVFVEVSFGDLIVPSAKPT